MNLKIAVLIAIHPELYQELKDSWREGFRMYVENNLRKLDYMDGWRIIAAIVGEPELVGPLSEELRKQVSKDIYTELENDQIKPISDQARTRIQHARRRL